MTAFDSGQGMFDSDPQTRNAAVDRFPNRVQGLALGLLARPQHVGAGRGATRKSGVPQHRAARRPAPAGWVGQPFVLHAAGNRPAPALDITTAGHGRRHHPDRQRRNESGTVLPRPPPIIASHASSESALGYGNLRPQEIRRTPKSTGAGPLAAQRLAQQRPFARGVGEFQREGLRRRRHFLPGLL